MSQISTQPWRSYDGGYKLSQNTTDYATHTQTGLLVVLLKADYPFTKVMLTRILN